MKLFLPVLALLLPLATSATERLQLTGSSTIAPLMLEIGKRYEKLHPEIRVDVQSGGSARGIQDARSGTADIGMVSRALKSTEADLTATTVAYDGIAIIVNQANPVTSLSDNDIRRIYRGELRNWSQMSGQNRPITVVNKAEGRSTLELFISYFKLRNSEIHAHVVIGDNQQGIKTIAGNAGAIGYVSIGTAEFEVNSGTPIRLLPMSGISASTASVRDGSFPLARPLNLVTRGTPSQAVQSFLVYASSAEVNDLIEDQFFVPPVR